MSFYPKTAMVFAAGLGTRMRHLTKDIPKPMVKVGGKPLIDWRLDSLVEYGIERVIVNTHYKAEVIEEHLKHRKDVEIIISHEDERLETGGGILRSREYLGEEPVFVINSDVIWLDDSAIEQGKFPALESLSENYEMEEHILLMVHQVGRAVGYHGHGDFDIAGKRHLTFGKDKILLKRGYADAHREYVFTGLQILDPQIVYDHASRHKKEFFSLSEIFAEKMGRDDSRKQLYGIRYSGDWLHVDSPESLAEAEKFLKKHNYL